MADLPLWDFSIDRYGRENVAALCLELQANYKIDVNILLFLLWIGQQGRSIVVPEGLDAILAEVDVWHQTVVVPLRRVRQTLKGRPTQTPDAQERLRNKIKSAELDAERLEQAMLQALWDAKAKQIASAGALHNAQTIMLDNICAYIARNAEHDAAQADKALQALAALCVNAQTADQ